MTIALLLVTNAQSLCVRGQVQSTNCSIQSWQQEQQGGERCAFVVVLERQLALEKAVGIRRLGLPFLPVRHLLNCVGGECGQTGMLNSYSSPEAPPPVAT